MLKREPDRLPPNEWKSISFCLRPNELDCLKKLAKFEGRSMSSLLRWVALQYYQKVYWGEKNLGPDIPGGHGNESNLPDPAPGTGLPFLGDQDEEI